MTEILNDRLYTIEELADLLQVTKDTIGNYIRQKRLKATLIGGRKYINEANVRRFLRAETEEQR